MEKITFKLLVEKVAEKLGARIQQGNLKNLVQSHDEQELFSFLRENLFKSDEKTENFLTEIKLENQSAKTSVPVREVSEKEFIEHIYKSIENYMSNENCKLSPIFHYFSPERDLVIRMVGDNKFGEFRVIAVKTS